MWYDRYQGPGQSADQYQQGQQVLFEFDTIFVRSFCLVCGPVRLSFRFCFFRTPLLSFNVQIFPPLIGSKLRRVSELTSCGRVGAFGE